VIELGSNKNGSTTSNDLPWWQFTGVLPMGNSTWSGWKMVKEEQRRTQGTTVDARNPSW